MAPIACETVFRRLALAAGAEILKIRAAGAGAEVKADGSPVTEADLAADRLISAGLAEAFPDLPVVTEERAASHGAGVEAPRFLLVDPLDGTKEFVKASGDFTVNIALIEAGAPVAGVVFAPAKGRLFQTLDSGGAVEERAPFGPAPGARAPLRVRRPDNAALAVVASASHRDAATDAWIARHEVAEFRAAGSSLKFCLVAAGEADLYPRFGRTMEWDTAAGDAVLRAAGGLTVRADDPATPLRYGKPGCDNPHFLAFAPGVELRT